MNWCAENDVDLKASSDWADIGDVDCSDESLAFTNIENTILQQLDNNTKVLSIGGDHSITFPILKAYAKHYPDITILHFDAHPDLYHDLDGNPHSHASPFARIMENKLAQRLVQLGTRTISPHQREQMLRFGVEAIEMKEWRDDLEQIRDLKLKGPLYLSFDMDALDPSVAPGVSHYEPGGFNVREVLNIIQSLDVAIVGADVVEYNPRQDNNDMTAFVGAKLLKEILAKMLG